MTGFLYCMIMLAARSPPSYFRVLPFLRWADHIPNYCLSLYLLVRTSLVGGFLGRDWPSSPRGPAGVWCIAQSGFNFVDPYHKSVAPGFWG